MTSASVNLPAYAVHSLGRHVLVEGSALNVGSMAWLVARYRPSAVVADLPYNVSRTSNGLRELDQGDYDQVDGLELLRGIAPAIARVPTWVHFCGDGQLSQVKALCAEAGRSFRFGAWRKTNPSRLNQKVMPISDSELLAFAKLPLAYWRPAARGKFRASISAEGPRCGGNEVVRREDGTPLRRGQKPQWLLRQLLRKACPPGGTVMDYCAGTGSLLWAAEATGRNAVLVEVDPECVESIRRRWAEREES